MEARFHERANEAWLIWIAHGRHEPEAQATECQGGCVESPRSRFLMLRESDPVRLARMVNKMAC